MIHTQQESIDTLKQILSQLLEDKKKKPKAKTPPNKSCGKRKKGESSSFVHTEDEEPSNSEPFKPPSEEELIQRTRVLILKDKQTGATP